MSRAGQMIEVDGRSYDVATIIRVLTPWVSEARRTRMETVIRARLGSLILGVEDMYSTHNGSACMRTAESLGIQDVVAVETRNPYPLPEVHEELPERPHRKITAHAHHWVDLHRLEDAAALKRWAISRSVRVLGTSPHASQNLGQVVLDSRPIMVLFGNEKDGLRPSTVEACDEVFRLDMFGFTESFNLSVSVGMVLAHLGQRLRSRQRDPRRGDLDPDRRLHILARWLVRDVRAAGPLLRRADQESEVWDQGPPEALS